MLILDVKEVFVDQRLLLSTRPTEALEYSAVHILISRVWPSLQLARAEQKVFRLPLIFNRGIKFTRAGRRTQQLADASSSAATLPLKLQHVFLNHFVILQLALLIEALAVLYLMKEILLFVLVVLYKLPCLRDLSLHALSYYLALLYLSGDLLTQLIGLPEQLETELDLLLLSHFRGRSVSKGFVHLLL